MWTIVLASENYSYDRNAGCIVELVWIKHTKITGKNPKALGSAKQNCLYGRKFENFQFQILKSDTYQNLSTFTQPKNKKPKN